MRLEDGLAGLAVPRAMRVGRHVEEIADLRHQRGQAVGSRDDVARPALPRRIVHHGERRHAWLLAGGEVGADLM
jgi:hypothetical protein